MNRLTDKEIDDLEDAARSDARSFGWVTAADVLAMIAELRERREAERFRSRRGV